MYTDPVAHQWRTEQQRCNSCEHLTSMHGEDGCGVWQLGVKAVPVYRCACHCTNTNNTPASTTNSKQYSNNLRKKGLVRELISIMEALKSIREELNEIDQSEAE